MHCIAVQCTAVQCSSYKSSAVVLVRVAQNNAQLYNLHVEQHKYEQCTICCACFVHKVKNCAQMQFTQQTYTMQMNHVLCLALCMFVV